MAVRFDGTMMDCPSCGVVGVRFHKLRERRVYACSECRFQIAPTANTILHDTRTPLVSWFYAMYLFCTTRHGVSGKELQRQLGVTYKTAHRIGQQIRDLTAKTQSFDALPAGHVELDAVTIWATPAGAGILQTALGAMAGSTISQYAGVVTGIQDDISFKGIAMAGITAGLTAGLAKIPGLDGANGFVGTLQDAARGMLANAATQGIAIATGMQKKFDFTGVAAAGVVAGTASAVGGRLGTGSFGARVASATASALAGAATRSAIDGTDFGDNVIAVLPESSPNQDIIYSMILAVSLDILSMARQVCHLPSVVA